MSQKQGVESGSESLSRAFGRSRKRSGAGRKSGGAELEAGMAENDRAEAERGAGTERGAGVKEIGWSAERLFRRSRWAHMLWSLI